jgi:hypothetical protein
MGVMACAPNYYRPETRATLVPQNGPRARVYATQYGGLTQRTVRTNFRSDKNAHVIVGRLGGDGRIEILFPENPNASTLILGGKTYNVAPFEAPYDGVPQLYRYASEIYRTHSARMDSYDGLGNGYVFVIASEHPFLTEALDNHGVWADSVEVDDYLSLSDPRAAIRDFANVLAGGMPYSLDYAGVLSTYAFGSYGAHQAWDCAAMVSVLGSHGTDWALGMMNFGWSGWSAFRYSPYAGCGFAYDRRYLMAQSGYFRRSWGSPNWGYGGWVYGGTTNPTITPTTQMPGKISFASGERRPGRLTADESGSGLNLARPRFGDPGSRPTLASTSTSTSTSTRPSRPRYEGPRAKPTVQDWAPPIRETRVPYDRSNRPVLHSAGSSGSSGSSSGSGSTRSSSGSSSGSSSSTPAASSSSSSRPSGSQGAGRIAPKNP